MTRTAKLTELIHEGKYAAEIRIEFHYGESRSSTMSAEGGGKLETVRLALRRGDIAEAAKYGRVFELKPVAAE